MITPSSFIACPHCGQGIMDGFVPVYSAVVCECGGRFRFDPKRRCTMISRLPRLIPLDFKALAAFTDPERPWNLPHRSWLKAMASAALLILGCSGWLILKDPIFQPTAHQAPVTPLLPNPLSSESSNRALKCVLSFLLAPTLKEKAKAVVMGDDPKVRESLVSFYRKHPLVADYGTKVRSRLVPLDGSRVVNVTLWIGESHRVSARLTDQGEGYRICLDHFTIEERHTLSKWLKSPSDLARIPVSIEPSSLYLVGTNERDHLALTLRDTTTEKMITAYAMKRSETTAALASMIAKRPDARFLDSINDINTTGAFTSTSRGHSSGMNLGMAFSPLSQNFDPVPSAIKAAVRLETDEGSGTIMITEITDLEESTDTYVASNQSEE